MSQMSAYSPSRKPGFRARVPASSANFGPGFDVLAVALDVTNTYDVWEMQGGLTIEVAGEGTGAIPTDERNLFYSSMMTFFALSGYQPPGLLIRQENVIPIARGLGSSAATIIGGLLAARFFSGYGMDDDRLLDMASSLEGHADNTSAAFWGGFILSIPQDGGRHTVRKLSWPLGLNCCLFVPELLVSTESAREVLPETYKAEDVIHNLSRLALFLSALEEGRLEDLELAFQDRLHQPYRAELVPGLNDIIAAASKAGAHGAFLSGAGPSVLALYSGDKLAGERVAKAMAVAARGFGLEGKTLVPEVRVRGADYHSLPTDPSGKPLAL